MFLSLSINEITSWILLFSAITTVFVNQKYGFVLLFCSILLAWMTSIINWLGVIVLGSGFLLAILCGNSQIFTVSNSTKILLHYLLHSVVVIWAILLTLHVLPGLTNLLVLENVHSGKDSTAYSMYLNIDKAMVIFALILLMPTMLKKKKHQNEGRLVFFAIMSLLLLPLLGIYFGLIKPELSFPCWIWLFVINNLLITCVAEEVFFRGYLQTILSRFGNYNSVIIAGLLFGLAHFAGGMAFIMLASIAGIAYGLIYLATGRLYLAILAHFSFNLYHLLFFTYPLLKG